MRCGLYASSTLSNTNEELTAYPYPHHLHTRKMTIKMAFFILLTWIFLAVLTPPCATTGNPQTRDFYREFEEDWCRERRARMDWRSMLSSCPGRARQWGVEMWPEWAGTASNYSYISWIDPKPLGHYTKIHIQTVSQTNRSKLIGGDSWRAVVHGPAGVPVPIYDLGNGTYEMAILFHEPGVYSIRLYLDYTLCHGLKNPPYDWFKRGCRHGSFQPEGSLGSIKDYLQQPFMQGAVINVTLSETDSTARDKQALLVLMDDSRRSCSQNCTLLWDGYGRWLGNDWVPFLNDPSPPRSGHTAGTGILWVYGDSINRLLYESIQAKPLCTQVFRSCYYSPVWVYSWKHTPAVEMDLRYGGYDLNITKVLEELRSVAKEPAMDQDSALLINTGIHLLKSTTFRNYQKIIKGMIRVLKKSFRGRVVWKTITALGKQTHLYTGCVRRFHTEQRIQLFNAYAMKKMCKAGYAVIDVYPISHAYPEGTNDGVHYNAHAFYPAESALYTYFT
ncbi:uncharacterized protein LOC116618598 isoform X1 [Nematostella vectensis]|uniref:uncharacterized protein LOC116618598 isoform X1 n=2 Tax=Nematostella vectensis TaxID=45351 RepID=UPI0020777ABB|nr:uncharacterized protein LOC116618598 isoform X1 [Nematostella vectensis]